MWSYEDQKQTWTVQNQKNSPIGSAEHIPDKPVLTADHPAEEPYKVGYMEKVQKFKITI